MDLAEEQLSRLGLIRSSVALKPLRLSFGFATQGPDVAEADGGINFEKSGRPAEGHSALE